MMDLDSLLFPVLRGEVVVSDGVWLLNCHHALGDKVCTIAPWPHPSMCSAIPQLPWHRHLMSLRKCW